MRELRFAVGKQGINSSEIWKAWANKGDVYLLQRANGEFSKFSLHESGECRWAQNRSKSQRSDRIIQKWNRGPIPPKGAGQAVSLMSLVFPTNHLSSARTSTKETTWIDPAPSGNAIAVEFSLTLEDEATIRQLLAQGGARKLLNFQGLNHGINWLTLTTQFACGDVTLTVPAAPGVPGIVFGHLEFPSSDTTGSGRPVRMLLSQPRTEQNPTFWELGGFRAEPSISPLKA